MSGQDEPVDPHWRICANRNPRASFLFFGCTTLVAIVAFMHFGQVSVRLKTALDQFFAVSAFAILLWMIYLFECFGERIVAGVWAASQGINLFVEFMSYDINPNDGAIGIAILAMWFVGVLVSASMLGSALRSSRTGKT